MLNQLRLMRLMLLAACLVGRCISSGAQQPPDERQFDRLAEKIVKTVTKTDAVSFLTTPLAGCLSEPQLCADFDAVVRASLEKQIPAAKFIDRDDALKHLADHGFLGIDAYMGALDSVGRDAGAEVVIGENVQHKKNTSTLRANVTYTKYLYALADLSQDVPCTVASKTKLSLMKDRASGVFMIVLLPDNSDDSSGDSRIVYPSCLSCPDPHYTGDAKARGIQGIVRLLVTVTAQGKVENAEVLGAVEDGLAMASIRAVNGWKLKPAMGPDGKPVPSRVPLEITFRLLP